MEYKHIMDKKKKSVSYWEPSTSSLYNYSQIYPNLTKLVQLCIQF